MNQDPKTGKFVKGNLANPGGRKKGVATLVKELSNDYRDYIEMLDQWSRNTDLPVKERRECVRELLNRSLGMARQSIESSVSSHIIIGPSKEQEEKEEE